MRYLNLENVFERKNGRWVPDFSYHKVFQNSSSHIIDRLGSDGFVHVTLQDDDFVGELVKFSNDNPQWLIHVCVSGSMCNNESNTDHFFLNGSHRRIPYLIHADRNPYFDCLPLQEDPQLDSEYYLPDFASEKGWTQHTWQDSDEDKRRLAKGLVYDRPEGAAKHIEIAIGIFQSDM